MPFELIFHPEDGAFGHVGMIGQDLFHRPGGQPVTGHIDNVVGPGHHEHVTILIDETGIGGLVIAGKFIQV